jgi:hypothetical protein
MARRNAWFHAVVPDQRAYGQTEAPAAIDQSTLVIRGLERRA